MIYQGKIKTRVPKVPLHEAVFFNIREYEDKIILADGGTGRTFTFRQLSEAVRSFASALTRRGIRKGDVIGFYAPNSVEYCVAFLGCISTGAVFTGINFNYTEYELNYQIADTKAKAIVTVSANLDKVKEVQKKHNLELVITLDEPVPSCLYFEDLLKDNGSAYPHGLCFNVHEDLAAIQYSSGTTGLPKGVMLTHYNLVANGLSAGMCWLRPASDGPAVLLCFLPIFHQFGLTILICALLSGTKLVTLPAFQPDTFLVTIQTHKVTQLFVVPPVVLFLAKSPLVQQYDVSSVKAALSSGAPLKADLEREFLAKFNIDSMLQGYGLTELSALVTVSHPLQYKPGSAGRLGPNTVAKLIDPSDGTVLSVGEEGELCIKGPQMMKGYLNKPEATWDIIDKDGWLHTGDIGYFDKDGDLFITGRIKELIKHKGFQVAPAELEGLIITHPGVEDVAVIGIPDEAAGELPRAFVVRKPQSNVTSQEIADFVKAHLSRHKWLSGGVQFVPSIPKTPSGKIIRRDVVKLYRNSRL